MRAMVLTKVGKPLEKQTVAIPTIGPDEVLVEVHTCGVCRTDLHIIDGEVKAPKLPLILGHQVVGAVAKVGSDVKAFQLGQRVGMPWLHQACGKCEYCKNGKENLCDKALFTGLHTNGGFAQYCVAKAQFLLPLDSKLSDLHLAPLLCAGLIGYRAFSMVENAKKIGFYGFGVSAHILVQFAKAKGIEVYAFTRKGDHEGQEFAKKMGAIWAASSEECPPTPLDAAIIFAPVGSLIPTALKAVKKGGKVVCAGIHMSDIPTFPYSSLWNEKTLCSVANLTRKDGKEFFKFAAHTPIETHVQEYPLEKANEALNDLRQGAIPGAAVLRIKEDSA